MYQSIEANYVQIPKPQWNSVYDLVFRHDLSSEEKLERMRSAFEVNNVPINGYFENAQGQKWSFIDVARMFRCEPLMQLIAEQAPNKATEGVDIIAESVWSERILRILFDKGFDLTPAIYRSPGSLLLACAENGTPETIALLVEKGLEIDAMVSSYGSPTPAIVHAARYSKTAIVEGFLRAGADPHLAGAGGETFLHAAVRLQHAKREAFVDEPVKVSDLRQILDAAVARGVEIDLLDKAGQSPLHLAARLGYNNKVVALLEYGADADLRDAKNKTPLMLAKAFKRPDATNVLLSWKAHQATKKAIGSALARPPGASK